MRLLSCQEEPSCVKSKTSAMFSPDPKPPATMIMGRSSCSALLNIVHAYLSLACIIDSISIGLLLRLLELNFNTVAVLPEFNTPPKIREREFSYIAIFWACQKKVLLLELINEMCQKIPIKQAKKQRSREIWVLRGLFYGNIPCNSNKDRQYCNNF